MSTVLTRPAQPALHTLRHLGGKAVARLLGLPPVTTDYTVQRVRVPMRDGVQLAADHYEPATASPAGTLLVRGPYGRGFPYALLYGTTYAARGYHVVLQSVRGRFGSGGVFEPMANEVADGADTVAWLREQPWFTGRFATLGMSYLGFTQWALLQDPPPELATAVIVAGTHDWHESTWGTGTFAANDFLDWSDMVAHQEDPVRMRAAVRHAWTRRKVAQAAAGVPLGGAARALLGAGAPWFESWVEHSQSDDPFWNALRCNEALDRVQVPVLLMSGWQDIFSRVTLQQYAHLRGRGVDVALTVGPWTHPQLPTKAFSACARETLDWLGTHLGDAATSRRPGRVRVYVTGGGGGWRSLPDWPPATTDRALYLRPGGHLGETAPTLKGLRPAIFRYDPDNPTPTTGGPILSPDGGYRDDSRLASRADVLAFTSATLTEDVYAYGSPVVELAHGADNPHADLFVRVSEVDAKGRSRNVSEAYRRLRSAAKPKSEKIVRLDLDAMAHRFRAGSRIRVLIAGSWSPRYAHNLGSGEPVLTGRQPTPVTHTVRYGRSRLLLPVGPAELSANGVADPGGDRG
ncbi:CocE/NonD family hydrolase [Mycobacterium sp.]|uniref:CocE/NonD family hydrolase n=1 Tax=Mycobacterium sp. TaxID=1785 RepID=UPI003F81498A